MATLNIGQSALAAAQIGLDTTAHNIANASTPGYSRQVVVQGASIPQNVGEGFRGQGVDVTSVKRIYNDFLATQSRSAQTTKSGYDSYYMQIRQVDNLLADADAGLSPVLQDFFASVQELSSNPASMPARQAVLSSAEGLPARLRSLAVRLDEVGQGVNSQVAASVGVVNTYAQQISALNEIISKLQSSTGQSPNDLLDQRDQLILDLNKEIKASVVKQGDGKYNVFIGSGQPLVVGSQTYSMTVQPSPFNPEKLGIGYQGENGVVSIDDASLSGGRLGGLLAFRSQSLEPAQNALGRIGIALAGTFNTQHAQGLDLNGDPGGNFFTVPSPVVNSNLANTGDAEIAASISGPNALTTSDYELHYADDGTNQTYTLVRLSDQNTTTYTKAVFEAGPQTVDGVEISLFSGTVVDGDSFLIRPTIKGAADIAVAITDPAKIAAADTDGGVGNNRNALLLSALQTANTIGNSSASFQGAYSHLVSTVGNKTRELEVTNSAAGKILDEVTKSIQTESGVNLDEEAANLLRYQQAYQAAAKVMQIANEMFQLLLSLGNN